MIETNKYTKVREGRPESLVMAADAFKPSAIKLHLSNIAEQYFELRKQTYYKEDRIGFEKECDDIDQLIADDLAKARIVTKVLDIGCLIGVRSKRIQDRYDGIVGTAFSLYGVDIVDATDEAGANGLEFQKCDLNNGFLPYADSSMDAVLFLQTLGNIHPDSRKKILLDIQRILRPDGIVYVQVTNFPFCEENAPQIFLDCVKFGTDESGREGYKLGDYFQWFVDSNGTQVTEPVFNTLFSEARFRELIKRTGLLIRAIEPPEAGRHPTERLYILERAS